MAEGEIVAVGPDRRGRVVLAGVRAAGRQGPRPDVCLTVDEVAEASRWRATRDDPHPDCRPARRRSRSRRSAGLAMFLWPLLLHPADGARPPRRRPVHLRADPAGAARRRARRAQQRRHGRQDPRHARRALRARRRAATDGRGHRRHRDRVLPAGAGRSRLRRRVRVRARLHHAVRLRAAHRRRRPVAAVPDAGVVVGRDGRRAAAAGDGQRRDRAARRLRRRRGLRVRLPAEPVVLAVRRPGAGGSLSLRAGRVGAHQPAPLLLLQPGHLHLGLGHRPGHHQRAGDRARRAGAARGDAPRGPQGGVRRSDHLRTLPSNVRTRG